MKRSFLWFTTLVAGAIVCGCDGTTYDQFTEDDVGSIYLSNVPNARTITLVMDACYSSSCSNFGPSECMLVIDGTDILMSAQGSVTWRDGVCTTDCVRPAATCDLPELAAGTYTVHFGEREATFDWPVLDNEIIPIPDEFGQFPTTAAQ